MQLRVGAGFSFALGCMGVRLPVLAGVVCARLSVLRSLRHCRGEGAGALLRRVVGVLSRRQAYFSSCSVSFGVVHYVTVLFVSKCRQQASCRVAPLPYLT